MLGYFAVLDETDGFVSYGILAQAVRDWLKPLLRALGKEKSDGHNC